MVDIARFFMEFTQDESCGKCTPCRVGTRRMLEILQAHLRRQGRDGDIERLEDAVPADQRDQPVRPGPGRAQPGGQHAASIFRDEYEAHIYEKRCPAKVCRALIRYEILPDVCTGCTVCARNCPVERHQRRAPPAAHDRSGCLHPLRHLHAGVQLQCNSDQLTFIPVALDQMPVLMFEPCAVPVQTLTITILDHRTTGGGA